MIRTVENIMKQYDCDSETAQRYCDLRDEGHPQYQALVMAGLRDPWEAKDPTPREQVNFAEQYLLKLHKPCTLGMGCDDVGVCYAEAHGDPDQCGRK